MISFTKRNLKIYFRDKGCVFFSLLSVFIILALYIFFLGNTWSGKLGALPNKQEMMNHWIMAGILAVAGFTTAQGILASMVRDRSDNILKDFYVSPVKRMTLAAGYWLSGFVVSNIMTLIALTAAEIYIVAEGGTMISWRYLVYLILFMLLANFMNTSIVLFLLSLFKSMNAYSAASIIVGTLIGFLTGIYVPIGSFSDSIQWIIKCFPISQSAAVYRQLMMHASMESTFEGVPTDVVTELKEHLGIFFTYGDYTLGMAGSMVIIAVTGVLFFFLSWVVLGKKRQ